MSTNALRDIPWIVSNDGLLTPREALLRAHQISGLDLSRPAFQVSSQLRILVAVLAITLYKSGGKFDLENGLSAESIDEAINEIGSAANIDDPEQPFLQQPALKPKSPADKTRIIEPGAAFPVKKLSPTTPPDQANEFWQRANPDDLSFPAAEAVMALAVYHNFAPAGNNAYDGQKCVMGAPGLRFPGKDNSATEVLWHGSSLLETLALNTPQSFIETYSLPAWADRTGTRSCITTEEPPLWRATWSSNAPVCIWEGTTLVGARSGGVPETWYRPSMGKAKDSRKKWWDDRNTEDPFYFYIPDDKGARKAQRLDIGKDPTALAVDWLAKGKFDDLRKYRPRSLRSPRPDQNLLFLRHQIGGTASSPSIRASLTLFGDHTQWSPNETSAREVILFAEFLEKLHWTVTSPFRRYGVGDKQKLAKSPPTTPFAFDQLEHRRPDASTAFWRYISEVFEESLKEIDQNGYVSDITLDRVGKAAMRAFNETLEPHYAQIEQHAAYVRNHVSRFVHYAVQGQKTGEDQAT